MKKIMKLNFFPEVLLSAAKSYVYALQRKEKQKMKQAEKLLHKYYYN